MSDQSALDAQRKAIASIFRLSQQKVDLSLEGDVLIYVLPPTSHAGRFSADRPAQTRMRADFGSGKKMPVDDGPVFFHFHLGSKFATGSDPTPARSPMSDDDSSESNPEQKNGFEEVD